MLVRTLVLIVLLALAGCQSQTANQPTGTPQPTFPPGSRLQTIHERGTLRVALRQDVLQFAYLEPMTNNWDGLEVAIAQELARAILGDPAKVEYVRVTATQRLPFLRDDTADLVLAQLTPDVPNDIAVSEPYYDGGQRLLVPRTSGIKDIDGLRSQTVCAVKKSASLRALQQAAPGAIVLPVDSWTECLTAVSNGSAAAITADSPTLVGLAHQDPNLMIVGEPLTNEPYVVGMLQGQPDLLALVNRSLETIKQNGRWAEIYKHYLGDFTAVPTPPGKGTVTPPTPPAGAAATPTAPPATATAVPIPPGEPTATPQGDQTETPPSAEPEGQPAPQ